MHCGNLDFLKYHIRKRRLNHLEEADKFWSSVLVAIEKYGEVNIFNMDETWWGLVPHDEKDWAPKGADEVTFDINSKYFEKTRFNVISTITSSGEKLDFTVITKERRYVVKKFFEKV